MANSQHLEQVRKGPEFLNKWREARPREQLDLRGASLKKIDLQGADLSVVNLSGSDLDEADLTGAELIESDLSSASLLGAILVDASIVHATLYRCNLSFADLEGADLEGADMEDVDFERAYLVGANLRYASLRGAKLFQTDLSYANLDGAVMGFTTISDCDVRLVDGLENVTHEGPTSIGIDTILRSEGDIPHAFLRGCGLPDHIIDFVDSIAKKPIQFYSCFLSHSTKDKAFARHLFDKLQGAGVRCWYFPESARTGEPLREEINRAIHFYDKLVIICTRNSLNSQPVIDEIEEGLQREQEEKTRRHNDEEKVVKGEWTQDEFARQRYHTKVLFPIALDDYVFADWNHPLKFELPKNRVIGDFRGWEDFKTFDRAFQKLLNDLNSTD